MKKMNLKIFGLEAKMILPLFLFLGLFLLSANSVNAQFVNPSVAKEKINKYVQKLPPRTAALRTASNGMNDAMIDETVNSLRHRFGQSILRKISEGYNVDEAIEKTYTMAKNRIDKFGSSVMLEKLDAVKSEYVTLLTD